MATDLITAPDELALGEINKYDFVTQTHGVFKARKGLNAQIVSEISEMKREPRWMRDFRLRSLEVFEQKTMPRWGGNIGIDFQDIYYYLKPTEHQGKTWDDVPTEIKETFDKLGIPEAERKYLAGVKAQFESEVVYGSLKEDLAKKGVIFTDTDTAVREHPDLVRKYFGTIIPPADNKFAALNSAVWSGGSFIYVPKGVKVDIPLQAYFRINAENMGQFERTLIICDEDSFVHYIEVDAENVTLGHEATVSKVSDEQLFYLMSRGIPRAEAETMIVNGFIEPFTKELPLEYAVELNRLIQLEMEGSVG